MHDIQSARHWRKINPDRVISLGSPCQGLLFSVCDTESYLFVMWLNRMKRNSQNFTHDWAESMWPHSHLWPGSTTTASFWGISTLTLTDCIWTSLIIWPKQSFVVTDIPVPKGCREVPQYQWPLTFRTSHGVWFNPVTTGGAYEKTAHHSSLMFWSVRSSFKEKAQRKKGCVWNGILHTFWGEGE